MTRQLAIAVDHGRCVGNAMCLATAPTVFDHDEGGQSVVVDPAGADPDTVMAAARACPTGAITVSDGNTGETLFSV